MSIGGGIDGVPEVLAFEPSSPGPRGLVRGWSRIALTLVAGTTLGGWTGAEVSALADNRPTALVAGPLHTVRECAWTCLSVSLRNDGRAKVDVQPVALGGTALAPGSHVVTVRPGRWATVPLHAPVTCDGPRPGRAATLTLRVEGDAETSLITVPLRRGAGVPGWRYDRLCDWGVASDEADEERAAPAPLAPGAGSPCFRLRGDDTLELCVPLAVERTSRDVPAGVTER